MNDPVDSFLKTLRVPDPPRGARDRAWEKARVQFLNRPLKEEQKLQWWKGLSLVFAGAAAVWFFVFPLVKQVPESAVIGQEGPFLSEMRDLFPDRFKAVVWEGGERQIVLDSEDHAVSNQPVVVEVTQDGKKTKIATFSGETVEFNSPGGESQKLEIMMTGDGKVLIVGPDFIWKSGTATKPKGLDIKAVALDPKGGI